MLGLAFPVSEDRVAETNRSADHLQTPIFRLPAQWHYAIIEYGLAVSRYGNHLHISKTRLLHLLGCIPGRLVVTAETEAVFTPIKLFRAHKQSLKIDPLS